MGLEEEEEDGEDDDDDKIRLENHFEINYR